MDSHDPDHIVPFRQGPEGVAAEDWGRAVAATLAPLFASDKPKVGHNARFDYRSTNYTLRYVTKSKSRYFLPYGIPLWDTLKMAQDTICKQKTYIKFCNEHEGYTKKNGKPRATAEILYRYITQSEDFSEEHQGIDDVMIEMTITAKCFRQHKKMRKLAFEK